MPNAPSMTPETFFRGDPLGLGVFRSVLATLADGSPIEVRVSKSQIALRRRRGFAWIWLPERYLGERRHGIVVLSIALGRHERSPRFKEVTHAAPQHWMHHLEVRDVSAIDDVVAGWLHEAADRAG